MEGWMLFNWLFEEEQAGEMDGGWTFRILVPVPDEIA